jgi:hypothetical protein
MVTPQRMYACVTKSVHHDNGACVCVCVCIVLMFEYNVFWPADWQKAEESLSFKFNSLANTRQTQ